MTLYWWSMRRLTRESMNMNKLSMNKRSWLRIWMSSCKICKIDRSKRRGGGWKMSWDSRCLSKIRMVYQIPTRGVHRHTLHVQVKSQITSDVYLREQPRFPIPWVSFNTVRIKVSSLTRPARWNLELVCATTQPTASTRQVQGRRIMCHQIKSPLAVYHQCTNPMMIILEMVLKHHNSFIARMRDSVRPWDSKTHNRTKSISSVVVVSIRTLQMTSWVYRCMKIKCMATSCSQTRTWSVP